MRARLALYDVAGRRVAVLADDTYPPCEQRVPLARMDQARRTLPAGTYYAASTLLCTPASLSQEVGLALGAQAGEKRLREVLTEAGFTRIRRVAQTPANMVLEVRA